MSSKTYSLITGLLLLAILVVVSLNVRQSGFLKGQLIEETDVEEGECGLNEGVCGGGCPESETCHTFDDPFDEGEFFCGCVEEEPAECGIYNGPSGGACGGGCPGDEVCNQIPYPFDHELFYCACGEENETPECGLFGGICAGECPEDSVCAPIGEEGICQCIDEEDAPACGFDEGICGGQCDEEGRTCGVYPDPFSVDEENVAELCGCVQELEDPVFCGDEEGPSCYGLCPTGELCQQGPEDDACRCYTSEEEENASCGWYDRDGVSVCGGECPKGQTCLASVTDPSGACTCHDEDEIEEHVACSNLDDNEGGLTCGGVCDPGLNCGITIWPGGLSCACTPDEEVETTWCGDESEDETLSCGGYCSEGDECDVTTNWETGEDMCDCLSEDPEEREEQEMCKRRNGSGPGLALYCGGECPDGESCNGEYGNASDPSVLTGCVCEPDEEETSSSTSSSSPTTSSSSSSSTPTSSSSSTPPSSSSSVQWTQ
jgi:hypothetical protein